MFDLIINLQMDLTQMGNAFLVLTDMTFQMKMIWSQSLKSLQNKMRKWFFLLRAKTTVRIVFGRPNNINH